MDSNFELKYEFLPNRSNPAGVFETMARYVQGYNELGKLLADSVGVGEEFELQLLSVKEGSILGAFSAAKGRIQEKVANLIFNSGIRLHDSLRYVDETATQEQVEELAKTLELSMGSAMNDSLLSYPHIDRKRFAHVLQTFSAANENLVDGESVEVRSSDGLNKTSSQINTRWRFTGNPKEMFDGFVRHFQGTLKLYVKVQVNQGGQVWTFKGVKNEIAFSAKLIDEKWLDDYQNVRIAPISPKDVLTAEVEYDIFDNGTGQEIKNARIIKVKGIKRYKVEQSGFDDF